MDSYQNLLVVIIFFGNLLLKQQVSGGKYTNYNPGIDLTHKYGKLHFKVNMCAI